MGGIGAGVPPIPIGGIGAGVPPIAIGGMGAGVPPIPRTLRRTEAPLNTTNNASTKAKK